MKGHMFCASQASTAICMSMDHIHKPTASASVAAADEERGGGRAIDRHNPIIKEGRRSFAVAPCSSVDDVPYRQLQKTKKLSSSSADADADADDATNNRKLHKGRRSTAGRSGGGGAASLFKLIADDISFARKSFSCTARPACDFSKTPLSSSRYLLVSDPDSVSGSSGPDPVLAAVEPPEPKRGSDDAVGERETEKKVSSSSFSSSSSSSSSLSSSSDQDQVVVLRVSLHCKGCEGKVRKHLSRMQGVTSFNIDFASKKVTVTGDITPLEVLASISKVKNAQFWTPQPPFPSSSLPRANLETSQH